MWKELGSIAAKNVSAGTQVFGKCSLYINVIKEHIHWVCVVVKYIAIYHLYGGCTWVRPHCTFVHSQPAQIYFYLLFFPFVWTHCHSMSFKARSTPLLKLGVVIILNVRALDVITDLNHHQLMLHFKSYFLLNSCLEMALKLEHKSTYETQNWLSFILHLCCSEGHTWFLTFIGTPLHHSHDS